MEFIARDNKQQHRLAFLVSAFLILVFHCCYFINGDLSLVPAGDNLDSLIPQIFRLGRSDQYFSFSASAVLGGYNGQVHRLALLSPWNITSLIFKFISNAWAAYLVNMMVINIISFLGIYLLNNVLFKKLPWYINVLLSFTFMLLPRYYDFGGAVYSALPLILFLWMKAASSKKFLHYLVLFLSPCLCGFTIGGFPILIFLVSLAVVLLISHTPGYKNVIVPSLVLLAGFIFADLNLFALIFSHLHLQRELRGFSQTSNLSLKDILHSFVNESYNEQTSDHLVILILGLAVFIFYMLSKEARKTAADNAKKNPYLKVLLILSICWLVFIPIFYNLYLRTPIVQTILPITKQFDMGRLTSLNPSLYIILLSYLCNFLFSQNRPIFRWVVYAVILINMLHIGQDNDALKENMRVATKHNYKNYYYSSLVPFKYYYEQSLFGDIKKKYALDDQKVMAYGIHPAVLSFNGYNTIDFYCTAYPLNYNYTFQEYLNIRNRDTGLWKFAAAVKTWGNRLYFVDKPLEKAWDYKNVILNPAKKYVATPDFNWTKLGADSVKYVVSSMPIAVQQVQLVDSIAGKHAYKMIYLYSIKP